MTRRTLPSGYTAFDFTYQGRPAKDQGDFGSDVGLADMCCVNQFGAANNDKFYHAGVVKTPDGKWWMYTEWGRRTPGKSWDGGMPKSDFQFEQFSDEYGARNAFAKKCADKNTKRIQQKSPGVWVGKSGKDGYLVQDLATREKGLPDAYKIKDDCGLAAKIATKTAPKTAPKVIAKSTNHHPEVVSLCQALVGGTKSYVKRATEASGVLPTLRTIEKVRDVLIPEALVHIERVSGKVKQRSGENQDSFENRLAIACTQNPDLQDLSRMVASLIPMPIPARADAQTRALATILSNTNIQKIQEDLDAFEANLRNEDWGTMQEHSTDLNVENLLGATVSFVDWSSEEGKWLMERWSRQTKNRHHQYKGLRLKRAFALSRPRVDNLFVASAKKVHNARKGEKIVDFADMQSGVRISKDVEQYNQANVAMLFHGTRSVNVAPIMKTDLKLPKSLRGVPIQGAAFGSGLYFAADRAKACGYLSSSNSQYAGDGGIKGRGAFMFFAEVILGKPYRATRAGVLSDLPRGYDSVFASDKWCSSLLNDEHVVWGTSEGPSHRLRYVLEIE